MTAQGIIFHSGIGKRPLLGGVGQDKGAFDCERAKQRQPGLVKPITRQRTHPEQESTPTTPNHAGKKRHSTKRYRRHRTLWLEPEVDAELQRVAKQAGLSFSMAGANLLKHALQHNMYVQQTAIIEPVVEKAIRTQMRRKTEFDVLCQFDQSQILRLLYNVLARLPDAQQMSEETLNQIRDESADAAHKDLRRRLEHQRTLLGDAVQD
ncbi:MAG: hypothetical protein M3261_06390, partial [Thermoproteota archaeon]|nr:hypothetical protein [Thermoproteota archaeon]